jgi:hypothetical protein
MCRSIKRLRTPEGPVASDEVRAAALQYVRKVSGFREPPKRDPQAFEAAVEQVATATQELLDVLPPVRSVAAADGDPPR